VDAPMRRRATVAGVVLVLLSALIGPASAAAGPNDTMAGAEGPVTGSFTAAIDTVNDVDWYFIYAQASTQLDVAISGLGPEGSCQNWDLALRNSEGRELESVHVGFNQVRHILYTLQTAGTYYLEVTGFYCEAVGYYRIDLAASPALLTSPPYVPPPPPPPSEPSSACRAAQQRVASLRGRLRRARSPGRRASLRATLRRARARAAQLCA
jgi:hypothetical protein